MNNRAEAILVGLILALALCFYSGLETLSPHYFLWDDNAAFFLPSYVHNGRVLSETGQLAHLNPHQYLGQIHLGNGQSGVLYPPVYLALGVAHLVWGDPRYTIDLLVVAHFLIAAVGMSFLLRRFGVRRDFRLFLSLLWVTYPFLLQVARNWVFISYVAAYLPWNLLLLDRLMQRPSFGRLLPLAAVKALLFFQGYVQYAILVALCDGIYFGGHWVFARPRREPTLRPLKFLPVYGATLLVTGILAAPLLLPMWQAKQLSNYRTSALSYEEFLSNAMGWDAFFSAQWGEMVPRAIHQTSGEIFYVGPLACIFLVVVLWMTVGRKAPAFIHGWARFGAVSVGSLVALVFSTRAYGLFYQVPLLSSFRWPFKHYLFFLFFATIAMGGAVELLARNRRRQRLILGLLAAVLVIQVALALPPGNDRPFGPNRVDRDLDSLRREVGPFLLGEEAGGRVLSLWQSHAEPRIERHLTHNFATLLGAYHLGGYDPLIARQNFELALGLEYSNIFRRPLDAGLLAYLSRWGVRYFLVPTRPPYQDLLAQWSQIAMRSRAGDMAVYENTEAWPLASFVSEARQPLEYRRVGNRLQVETHNREGLLRVALAPLPWYYWSADGQAMGAVEYDEHRQMAVVVPPGTRRVTIFYDNVPFRIGGALALSFLILSVGVAALQRFRHSVATKDSS